VCVSVTHAEVNSRDIVYIMCARLCVCVCVRDTCSLSEMDSDDEDAQGMVDRALQMMRVGVIVLRKKSAMPILKYVVCTHC